MASLTPEYLDMDFATMKRQFQLQLQSSDIFRDYNYEGANITLLIELLSYLGAVTTYYINRVAKNQYIDTADIYETVHMLARLRGYNPQGYRSSSTDLTVTVNTSAGAEPGDEIYIPAWKQIFCPDLMDSNGAALAFATVHDITTTIPPTAALPYSFTVPVRQGIVTTYVYTGDDLIDNTIQLPFEHFDYDDNIVEQEYPSIRVQVNDQVWTRVPDFYDDISGLNIVDQVYMFRYDKYQNYIVEFSANRTVPATSDSITITLLKTEGSNSRAAANAISLPETYFAYNRTTLLYLNNNYVAVANPIATIGGSDFESIQEIKDASTSVLHSQYRNVTKLDYIGHLESRSDVIVANVWGEQEVAPSGSIQEYNKVHISLIPDEWGTGTIETSAASAGIYVPTAYSEAWKTDLSVFLEPRKMLSAYEQYDLPSLVYFQFVVGIRIKRTYSYANVVNDVRDKLAYFFNAMNRNFNETISFLDITSYITDTTQESVDGETWPQTKGIENLVIRDINVLTHTVYEPNNDGNYPQYTTPASIYVTDDNKLRNIKLGFNQFPMLAIDYCLFVEET